MARGHIYPPQQAQAALGGWCRAANLAALRELALLWLAGTLANSPQQHRPGVHDPGLGPARERVVVALSGGPEGQTLIRRAARIATRSGADLMAVHATLPGRPAAAVCATLADQRRLTESLGGSYHRLADDDIPAALLAFARAENATRLVLGAARHTRRLPLLSWPGTTQRVIRGCSGIALHIVSSIPTPGGVLPAAGAPTREEPTKEGDNDEAEHLLARPRAASTCPAGSGTRSPRPGRPRGPRPPAEAAHLGEAAATGTDPIAHTVKPASPMPPSHAQIALSVLTACGGIAVARLVREQIAGLPLRIQSKGTFE